VHGPCNEFLCCRGRDGHPKTGLEATPGEVR
jgi:hypothetical protein